jgi:tetratricopeptide (TPR) repeat protein
MANSNASVLPPPTPEHRRIAAAQFERANQVVTTGNYDYGIRLLLSCCKLDPANLFYRQTLRRTEKAKYGNNLRGSLLAWLTVWPGKARIKAARGRRDHLGVLDYGERVLTRNPWEVDVQMDMATAADSLGLLDLAVWILEQARQKTAKDLNLNRSLARLYEKRGNFTQATALWQLIRNQHPADTEAQHKIMNLAAHETIARGNYEGAVAPDAPGTVPNGRTGPRAPRVGDRTPTEVATPTDVECPAEADVYGEPRTPISAAHGRVAKEAVALRARLEADPTNLHVYLQLAALYRRAGLFDEAKAVLEQGLPATGQAFEVALELADIEIEPFRQNLHVTEEKLKETPDDEELRKIRIRLRKEINTRELDYYRQKSERFPGELNNVYEMGLRLLRAGKHDEAIQQLQSSRSDPRLRWQSMMYLGHCFKARNNWRLAQRNFEEALQNLPPAEAATRKDLMFLLAQGLAEAGELTRAVDIAHELANLDFSYRDIGRLLDEWQAKLQQPPPKVPR